MSSILFETLTPFNPDLARRFEARFKEESAEISVFDEFFYILATLVEYHDNDFKTLVSEACDVAGFSDKSRAELFANDYMSLYNAVIALIKKSREMLLDGGELHGLAEVHQLSRALVELNKLHSDDLTEAMIHHANLIVGTLFEKYGLELTEDFALFERELDKTFKDPAISDLLLFLLEMLFGMETEEISASDEIAEEMIYAMIMLVTLAGSIGLAIERERGGK